MNKNCGDNCPFFNDPQKVSFSYDISILICDRTVLKFNEFKDKRESKR